MITFCEVWSVTRDVVNDAVRVTVEIWRFKKFAQLHANAGFLIEGVRWLRKVGKGLNGRKWPEMAGNGWNSYLETVIWVY